MFRFTSLLVLLIVLTEIYGSRIPKDWPIRHGRIVNGVAAQQGEFPGQLSLQLDHLHICGASVLNEYWALTTSNCVEWGLIEQMTLYAGSIDLQNGGFTYEVDQIVMHEAYDPFGNYKNDIAVLRVKTPFVIDNVNVKPITLPGQEENPADDSPAISIGWGFNENWENPTLLYKVDLAILNLDICRTDYINAGYNIENGQICAQSKADGLHGACGGDVGGPLFVNDIVYGLVSWFPVNYCVTTGIPNVFTKVSDYRDWISNKTGV